MEQDKFKDIKAGDVVYIVESVRYRFSGVKRFYVPRIVERTTKTQLIVKGGNRYKKDHGRGIGGEHFECAYYLGDKISQYSDDVVTNQLEERNDFVKKVNLVRLINSRIKKIEVKIDDDIYDLKAINEYIDGICDLIKEEKQ